MEQELENLRTQALADLAGIQDVVSLESWRITYLGRKGKLSILLSSLGSVAPDQRPRLGALANAVKVALESAFDEKKNALRTAALRQALEAERVDVTLPARPLAIGRLHIVTRMLREIIRVFISMGFQVVEGPEVEWDRYNFEMLNIPKDHPARDMWDTYYIQTTHHAGEILLRTHTSPNQARIMERVRPPVRVVVPGKCYRYEATDATHETMFYQVEGLAVDRGITFADMKGVLTEFAKRIFGADRRVRFRCDYFPFVEPGVDMAVSCHRCDGKDPDCRVCKGSGWLEIMGAGMVHPNVLAGVGYDPTVYTGFAFGLGPERIAMLKYGIDDIRLFYSNDLRFLWQFH